MDLAFSSKGLRDICESKELAANELGENVAVKLQMRLADLRATPCVSDIPISNLEHITHGDHAAIRIALIDGHSISFCSNHNDTPTLITGDIDWTKVTRVKIIHIGGEHD